jgi:hypothetical protein
MKLSGSGKYLNLNALVAGVSARSIIQGNAAAETWYSHVNGPVDQKIVRTRVQGGLYTIATIKDNLTSYNEPAAITVRLNNGNVGIKTAAPAFPFQVGDTNNTSDGHGAHVTAGGVWTNASSRTFKEDIRPVTDDEARETLRSLQPVTYRYINEPDEQYVGFIAEDVPDLVAMNDRKSLAPMDITAVLTKVVQDQDAQIREQKRINEQQQELLEELAKEMKELRQLVAQQSTN